MLLIATAVSAQDVLPPANPAPATVGAGKLDPAAVKPGTWYKRSPLPGAPKNPQMGYEGAWVYDPEFRQILRWGGHNNGGGGEQNSEMWAYDPSANTFKLMEPNYCPPGSCCCRDNVYDLANRRYVRFPAFSASHGWQWRREVYQNQSSVWAYDPAANQWRNMRPWPQANPAPLRGAAYDTDNQVIVVAQGEGFKGGTAVYDLYTNTWTMMNAKNEPPPRNDFGMAYDPIGKKFITFGSQNGSDPRTWVYDLRKNEWQGLELNPHPPEVRNGAVMAYDSLNKVMLCVALTWKDGLDPDDKSPTKIPDHLETWAFDCAKSVWSKVETTGVPDVSGSRNRMFLYDPDLNIFVLESRTNKEQGEWIFRYAGGAPVRVDPDVYVDDPGCSPDRNRVDVAWNGSPEAKVDVYRGTGERPWLVDYGKIGTALGMPFSDSNVKTGNIYYYYLDPSRGGAGVSQSKPKFRSQPGVITDLVVSVADPRRIRVNWDPWSNIAIRSSLPEFAMPPGEKSYGLTYNIYRAPVQAFSTDQVISIRNKHKVANAIDEPYLGTWKVGQFERIFTQPLQRITSPDITSFEDTAIDLAKKPEFLPSTQPDSNVDLTGKPYKWAVYAYRVTAVNKLGIESGPSPYYLTVPGPVSNLKSRERGKTPAEMETDLKWTANPEKGIQGYHVYRLEERGTDKDGFSERLTLLTPQPIKETTFTDKVGTDAAKRYYVVAVDALGQEGIVGSPTWGNREYAKYYVGFVEEWHQ